MYEKRVRKGIKLSILVGLLALITVISAFAAAYPTVNMDETGSITVTMNTRSDKQGDPVLGGEMTIYKVADVVSIGGTADQEGGYFFYATDEFKAAIASDDNPDGRISGEDQDGWPTLAEELSDYLYANQDTIDYVAVGDLTTGTVTFENLSVGLYLLIQTKPADGYYAANPFLVSVPLYSGETEDGDYGTYEYNVDATPKTQVYPGPDKKVYTDGDVNREDDDDGVSVNVGDTLTYKIDYENTHSQPVNITITDELDVRIDFVSADNDGVYDDETRTITWELKDVPVNTQGYVTFTATVNENALEINEINNTAKVRVGDNGSFVDTNNVENPRRMYYPIDEEIVTDTQHEENRDRWIKRESVNEYNAIEFEMTTNIPVVSTQDIADGEFAMLFHNELDSELKVDEHEDTDIHLAITRYDDANNAIYVPIPEEYYEEYYTVEVYDRHEKWSIQTLSLPVGLDTDDGVCTFHVTVDLSGLYNAGFLEDGDFLGDTEMTVYFFADLEGMELNGTYKSTIHYQVYDGYRLDEDSLLYTSNYSVVEVYTYEVDVSKTSTSTGAPLAGATFGIYYDEDCTDPVIRWDGESYAEYVVTSDSEGKAKFYGLAEGTYYLKELEAPSGYIYSDEVYSVELGDLDVNETKSVTMTPAEFAGATFGVYYDEDCTDPVKREGDDYKVEADANGNIEIYGLSGDTYYLKEIEAPEGRSLSDQVFIVSLDENTDSFTYILGVGNTPSSSSTSHHSGGGGGGGGSSGGGGGGSGSGGPGSSSGEGDSGGTVWDLLPLPETGQGWAMLIAVCAMIIAGVGLIVAHVVKRRN